MTLVGRAKRPWVNPFLAVLFITEPSWRWPLLGFFSIVALLTIKHDRISFLMIKPDSRQELWPKTAGNNLATVSVTVPQEKPN